MRLRRTGKRKTRRGAGRAVIKKAKKIIRKAKVIREKEMLWHSGTLSFNADITGIRPDSTTYFASTITYGGTMDAIFSGNSKVSQLRTLYEFVKLIKAKYTFIPYRRPINPLANYSGLSLMALEPRPEIAQIYPQGANVHEYTRDHKKIKISYNRSVSMSLPSIMKVIRDSQMADWQRTSNDPGFFYLPDPTDSIPPRILAMSELAPAAPPNTVVFLGHMVLRYTIAFKQFKNT